MSTFSFINRELSWLEFNQRVLNEALRDDMPLLDRLKFLAITDSNLDEFFQVRVGGLEILRQQSPRARDIAGLTPAGQLLKIRTRVAEFVSDQYALLNDTILPSLAEEGLAIRKIGDLNPHQQSELRAFFEENIAPLLTPFHPAEDIDLIPSMTLCVAAMVKNPESKETRIATIPLHPSLNRFLDVPATDDSAIVLLGDVVGHFAGELFPTETVTATTPFRLTRNTDIAVQEEDSTDFAEDMEEIIIARKHAQAVRLQFQADAPARIVSGLRKLLDLRPNAVIKSPGPIALSDFMKLVFISGFDHLRAPSLRPVDSPAFDASEPVVRTIARNDVTLQHPYHSYEPVIRLVEEAADDPQTLVIKQTIYRTASDSRFVKALCRAASNGKQVTALVELKARFDEERNLGVTEVLQRAGVQVVYGVKGFKTHAKITLVVRNEDGHLRRYAHLGTGNYNESTAKLYTDVSYFTARPDLTADCSLLFNAVTGRSKLVTCRKLVPAPTQMKRTLIALIDAEADRANQGEPARILAKFNSLQDRDVIEALYRASAAGVKIDLNVRGICCLQPGKEKWNKNITVVSIIDQFLEHMRIFAFGGRPNEMQVYISSADWMTRNLEKRIELMTPIEDEAGKKALLYTLEAAFKDNTQASLILPDGTSRRLKPKRGESPYRQQIKLHQRAQREQRNSSAAKAGSFTPHLPQ